MRSAMTGTDIQLRRIAMGLTQSQVAERMNVTTEWVGYRERAARVKAKDAERLLAALATFGTVPTVEVKVA